MLAAFDQHPSFRRCASNVGLRRNQPFASPTGAGKQSAQIRQSDEHGLAQFARTAPGEAGGQRASSAGLALHVTKVSRSSLADAEA